VTEKWDMLTENVITSTLLFSVRNGGSIIWIAALWTPMQSYVDGWTM